MRRPRSDAAPRPRADENTRAGAPSGSGLPLWLGTFALVALIAAPTGQAKELDQFTDRPELLDYYAGGYRHYAGAPSPERVDHVLDAQMNALLDTLAARLAQHPGIGDRARVGHVRAVFQHPVIAELVTPYEEWAKHDAGLPLYGVRGKGIYGHGVHYDDMRMAWYIELSPIVQVAGVLVGLDKLGHFLAQGFQYYEHYRSLSPDSTIPERAEAVRHFGHAQEVGQLGLATGGVYSSADLAANWAGMLFFLALFDDVDVEGVSHRRYFAPDGRGVLRRMRDFHWSEWVTDDWDELINPARIRKRSFYAKVVDNFWRTPGPAGSERDSICERYLSDPEAFVGPRHARSQSHYALPRARRAAAPHPVDIEAICAAPPSPDAAPGRRPRRSPPPP